MCLHCPILLVSAFPAISAHLVGPCVLVEHAVSPDQESLRVRRHRKRAWGWGGGWKGGQEFWGILLDFYNNLVFV